MVWDPKTKLVSPQFHVMFDDNFDTVQAPDPNIKQADTMDRLSKTNRYTYYDPFGNDHTYLFSHGGAHIHPDNLTPTIETCQASFTMTPTHDAHDSDTQNNISTPKGNQLGSPHLPWLEAPRQAWGCQQATVTCDKPVGDINVAHIHEFKSWVAFQYHTQDVM
jgi:hypothetical protein